MNQSGNGDVVAAIGLRANATAFEILALVDTTLAEAGLDRADLAAFATIADKSAHPALVEAAGRLGLPLCVAQPEAGAPNPSALVMHHLGYASVAEAVALHFGPLLVEKRRSATVTCALSRRLQPSAATAASTLATSRAGP